MSNQPLDDIKVIELATMVSGPYCAKLLADLGADVIKVESPQGDPARSFGPFPKSGPHRERSALFLYNNTSKRGITLDLRTSEGIVEFKRLIQWADVLIDNHPPDVLENAGLGWETLHLMNPALVYTSITPYGRTGPRAGFKAGELTIMHAGGLANLLPARSVDVDHPPVKLGGFQAAYHGAIAAALATLAVVTNRSKTGGGKLIDISLQEVILAMVSPNVSSSRYHDATWSRVPDRPPAMGRMETKDGYIQFGAADDHHFRAFREAAGKPDWLAGDEWDNRDYRFFHLMDIAPQMDAWMLEQKKEDLHQSLGKRGIPIGPLNTAKEVMENRQYLARKYFVEVDHPEAGKYAYPGWAYHMSVSSPAISRPAPLLGQHNEDVRSGLPVNDPAIDTRRQSRISPLRSGTVLLPLTGVRVLDFSWVYAGPYACMLLAQLGAEVIKIEGHKRSDLTRRAVMWPQQETGPSLLLPNQGMPYNVLNQNKKSLTLDLSRPEGVALARRLAAKSDIVIDNMRPGAMSKLGLGYEDLKKIRPDIIDIVLSSRGYNGPETDYLGFAVIHQAIGGLAYISGYPDDHPTHGSGGDADIMNALLTAFMAVTALHHRNRAGEGQFIDISQCESVTSLIGETILEYQMTSKIPRRLGNAHPYFAPHSVYRCWGVDRWLAIEIHTDEEFCIFAEVIGRPDLSADPRFADMAARKNNEKELDAIILEWTRQRDRDWMVNELCKAGLAAAPSRDAKDLYADRHLMARNAFVKIIHPEIGELELIAPPFKISGIEMKAACAPMLGEHNESVLKELLDLSDVEIMALRKKEIIMQDGQSSRPLDR